MSKAKVLLLDIETSPLISYTWGLFDQNIGLNQIKNDWHILAWSAKWLSDPDSKIMYADQRNAKNIEDDKAILKKLWKLMDEADVIVGQNSKRFDVKKLNARFIHHGFTPPSNYKQIDTMLIARKHFAFTSNKLEYLTGKLCTKHKKLVKRKYAGFELWKECLAGNLSAWKEMEHYNKLDVLSLQELYHKLLPWDSSINFDLYDDKPLEHICCGKKMEKKGYSYTAMGKFQRYRCLKCGKQSRDRQNLFSKEKRKSLKIPVS